MPRSGQNSRPVNRASGVPCGWIRVTARGRGPCVPFKVDLPGKLIVLGTPAEEGGAGKILLIRAGAFRDVDVAMMVHPADRASLSVPDRRPGLWGKLLPRRFHSHHRERKRRGLGHPNRFRDKRRRQADSAGDAARRGHPHDNGHGGRPYRAGDAGGGGPHCLRGLRVHRLYVRHRRGQPEPGLLSLDRGCGGTYHYGDTAATVIQSSATGTVNLYNVTRDDRVTRILSGRPIAPGMPVVLTDVSINPTTGRSTLGGAGSYQRRSGAHGCL